MRVKERERDRERERQRERDRERDACKSEMHRACDDPMTLQPMPMQSDALIPR